MSNYPEGADNARAPWNSPDVPDITVMMAENELCRDIEMFYDFVGDSNHWKQPSAIAGLPPMISTVNLLQLMLAKGDIAALAEIRRRFIACNQDFINRKIQELME